MSSTIALGTINSKFDFARVDTTKTAIVLLQKIINLTWFVFDNPKPKAAVTCDVSIHG